MAISLPNELIEVVVESLALKPRSECIQDLIACSTANSIFTAQCQKHIFHTVRFVLRHEKDGHFSSNPPEIEDLCQRTSLLSRSLNENPKLSAYVKCADYRLTTGPNRTCSEALREVFSALASISTLDEFTMGYLRVRGEEVYRIFIMHYDSGRCAEWMSDISNSLRRIKVKKFQLHNILGFPSDALPPSMEALELQNAEIDTVDGLDFRLDEPKSVVEQPIRLRQLLVKSMTGIHFFETIKAASKLDLSQLDELSVHSELGGWAPTPVYKMVRLRKLTVKDSPIDPHVTRQSFISRLNPSCYSTLSQISWNTRFVLAISLTPESPYGCLCDPPFTQLSALRDLTMEIDLVVGHFRLHPASFSAQWAQLPNLLTTPGLFPLINNVEITIRLEGRPPNGGPRTLRVQNTDLEIVENHISKTVYPSRFHCLENFIPESGTPLNFFFSVQNIST